MTRTSHHPSDELLLAHAAGWLPAGPALVTAVHLEQCTRCAARQSALEGMEGAWLDETPGIALRPGALGAAMAALDGPEPAEQPVSLQGPPPLPAGVAWPRALAGLQIAPWRWIGPGMRYSRVRLAYDDQAFVFLLRITAGKYLPQHAHTHQEFTQVLCGSFHDGRAQFTAGDFDLATSAVHHLPVVQSDGECVCLTAVQGRLAFDGLYGRLLARLAGLG
jgi:putative transcriptional regulator